MIINPSGIFISMLMDLSNYFFISASLMRGSSFGCYKLRILNLKNGLGRNISSRLSIDRNVLGKAGIS